ncbi:unnamed protein product [Gongylonema pulchrum]|uniref:Fe2OG dioxygenase domain-containing protein n=1 Tax=Gongylonema pulchrum TaxID=637853 RepID=A0A183EAK0_9BILA|nr:unnamed protein product [Gongylonema pulchrum]
MVIPQLRLTRNQAIARTVVAVIGLAIGAYGVATVYKPLQTNWICVRPSCSSTTKQNTMSGCEKPQLLNRAQNNPEESSSPSTTSNSGAATAGPYRDELPLTSLMKQIFKFYKRRDREPDLSDVLDLRRSSANQGITCSKFVPQVTPSDLTLEKLGLRPVSQWTASTVAHRPGMVMLNDIFEPSNHLQWIERSLTVYPEPPGFTNVGLHVPNAQNIFEKYVEQLRWCTLGLHYDWTTKLYPSKGEPLPEELSLLADVLSQALGLGPMSADATIINFYARKSTLSPHIDRSERTLSQPLISVSFGQSAIYLAGGTELDDPVDAFYIHSGDALVIYGSQRLIYHAVPRILQDRKFEETGSESIVKYANCNRVNITIRQVDQRSEQ